MVVGQQIGKVGVGVVEGDDHLVAVGPHRLDAAHDAQRAGLRIFVGMALERGDHVLGGDGLAVVELDVLANLERPDLGVVGSAVFLGDRVPQGAVGIEGQQIFAPAFAEGVHDLGEEAGGVEAVGRFTADETGLEDAAPDRPLSVRRARQQRVGEGRGDAERGRAAEKIAAAQPAGHGQAAQIVEFV